MALTGLERQQRYIERLKARGTSEEAEELRAKLAKCEAKLAAARATIKTLRRKSHPVKDGHQ